MINWSNTLLLQRIYEYYAGKGFKTIFLSRFCFFLSLTFFLFFSWTILFFFRPRKLFSIAFSDSDDRTDSIHLKLIRDCFRYPETYRKEVFCFIILSLIIIYSTISLCHQIKYLLDIYPMKNFFTIDLRISSSEMDTIRWREVLNRCIFNCDKIRYLKYSNGLFNRMENLIQTDLTILELHNLIAMIIMRKENFLISFVNEKILDPIQEDLFFLSSSTIFKTNIFYSRILEIILERVILNTEFLTYLHNHPDKLNPSFQESLAARLIRQFRILGFLIFLFSPLIFFSIVFYMFFRYTEELKNRAENILATKTWTRYARYRFRCFNELDADFEERLNETNIYWNSYLSQFYSSGILVVLKSLSFILGTLIAILIFFALLDESLLLEVFFGGRSLLWWLTILGTIVALIKGAIPKKERTFNPWIYIRLISEKISIPEHWSDTAHQINVYNEMNRLFTNKIIIFFQELLAVVLAPYFISFYLPRSMRRLISFLVLNVEENYVGMVLKEGRETEKFRESIVRVTDSLKENEADRGNLQPCMGLIMPIDSENRI